MSPIFYYNIDPWSIQYKVFIFTPNNQPTFNKKKFEPNMFIHALQKCRRNCKDQKSFPICTASSQRLTASAVGFHLKEEKKSDVKL